MLKNMKIAQRIIVGFVAVALITAFVGVYGSIHLRSAKSRTSDLYQNVTIPIQDLVHISLAVGDAEIQVRQAMLGGTPEAVAQAQARMAEIRASANQSGKTSTGGREIPKSRRPTKTT